MEDVIGNRDEFLQRYWDYYLMLEKDFLSTEQYVAIDEVNFNTYSNEYIKQYQAICSEIDVLSKSFCKKLNKSFKDQSINAYCKCIVDNNPDFSNRTIKVIKKNLKISPWKDWSYLEKNNKKGQVIIESSKLEWWDKYNKIKHRRTTKNNETGLPYYKLANQKNVLNALAGLFQLEMYYYRLLRQNLFPTEPDMPYPLSRIFEIEKWGNRCQMISDIIFIEHDE